MRRKITTLLAVSLFWTGCDQDPGVPGDPTRDTSAPITAEENPEPPSPPAWPSGPYCDAAPLDGLQCECEGYPIDVITHQGEVVADGQDPLVLRLSGTGAFSAFGICDDSYLWEDGGPGCMLTVKQVDEGCRGIVLSHIPDLGTQGPSACPLVPEGALVATCSYRDEGFAAD